MGFHYQVHLGADGFAHRRYAFFHQIYVIRLQQPASLVVNKAAAVLIQCEKVDFNGIIALFDGFFRIVGIILCQKRRG